MIGRQQVANLRPLAEDFAAAVLAGARSLTSSDSEGRLRFRSESVAEIHDELTIALKDSMPEAVVRLIEERTSASFPYFVDRILLAWIRAEPDITHFMIPDRRGDPAFLFDVLRAELGEIGIDVLIEPREVGYLVVPPTSKRRLIAPVFACVWLGIIIGWLVEATGIAGAGTVGFGAGLGLGLLIAIKLSFTGTAPICSECGTESSPEAESCERCKTRFCAELDEEDAPTVG